MLSMPLRLKSRTKSNPYHFKFFQAQTGWESWKASPASEWDFGLLCRELQNHRKANPRFNLPTDMATIEAEVDLACAKGCMSIPGAEIYVIEEYGGSSPAPKVPTPQQQSQVRVAAARASKIWSGLRTTDDWIDSSEPPVSQEQSNKRASICAECPKNGKGDWTTWFTAPAAEAIKRQVEKLHARKLSTVYDASIQTCTICLCPLHLKVHTPIEFIRKHTKPEVIQELRGGKSCWVVSELGV